MMGSTDKELGRKIHALLLAEGLETPMVEVPSFIDKKAAIEEHFREIMRCMGLDLKDDSLMETPKRVAKMFTEEIFRGLNYDNFPKCTIIENKMAYDSLLLERHIKVHSVCEHHFLPILGEATIGYIPNDRVIGLSKLNRIVNFFSRRPQVQERLTEQIFCALQYILATDNVAVSIKGVHSCVRLRGAEDINSDTVTTRLGGAFEKGELRNEFYSLMNG